MRPALRAAAAAVLGVLALYLAIWPHETGHAIGGWLVGCKKDWWTTDTSWFLWDSWGGPVDMACLHAKGLRAEAITDVGGIVVNLLLLALAPLAGAWWRLPGARFSIRFLFTLFLALSNYAEAFSYLVLNTAWLKSDMVSVVAASGVSRWIWFTASLVLGAVVARLLAPSVKAAARSLAATEEGARAWVGVFVLYTFLTGFAMAMARVYFT